MGWSTTAHPLVRCPCFLLPLNELLQSCSMLQQAVPRPLRRMALFVGKPKIIMLPCPTPCNFPSWRHGYPMVLENDPPAREKGTARRMNGNDSGAPGTRGLQAIPSIQRQLLTSSDPLTDEAGTMHTRKMKTRISEVMIAVKTTVPIYLHMAPQIPSRRYTCVPRY